MGVTSPRVDDTFFEEVTTVITECVISFEESGHIVYANQAATELLGYGPDELLGRPLDEVLPNEESTAFDRLQRRARGETVVTSDLSLRHTTDRMIPVRLTLNGVNADEQQRFIAAFRERPDPDERSEYELRLAALNDASRELMAAQTRREIAQITVDVVETVLDRPRTTLWLSDDGNDELRAVVASDEPASDSSTNASAGIDPITEGTVEMASYRSNDATLLEEYDSIENAAHPEMGLEARLVVPLGEHGLLTVGSTTKEDLNGSLQELIDILSKNTRTAFDRIENERVVYQRSGAIDAAIDGMAITDESGVYTYMNDVHAELFGRDDPETVVGTTWKDFFEASEVARYESEVIPALDERGSWRGEATGQRTDGTRVPLEITLSTLADGGLVCIVRDITEQKRQERQLEALNEFAQNLIRADDIEEIGEIGIEVVESVLGFESACLRLFDTDANQLRCTVMTTGAEALLESHVAYDLEATLAGHAFRNERTIVNPPSDFSSDLPEIGYPSFHVPIGRYGVISIVLQTDTDIDDRDVHLVEMLSVNVRTAIERAERSQLLKATEREARNQRDQLETLYRINILIQEIGRRLIEATTREEIERTVCDHLVNSDLYHSAWIGDIEASTDHVATRTGSGIADGDLEAINEMSLSSIGNGSVERMLETDSVEVVRHYQIDGQPSDPDSAKEVRSTGAIPLTYGDSLLGVLVVNGVGTEIFGEEAVSGFESLGEVIGFAINAIRHRTLLLSDSVIELEFVVSDTRPFFLDLTAALDCEWTLERSVPIESNRILDYHTVAGTDPESVLEFAADAEQIEDAQVLTERDDSFVLQTLTSESISHVALQGGATLQSATAVEGEARIVLEAPMTTDVREIVALIEESFARVDLKAKREHNRSIETADEFRQAVDSALTEKQRAAIESAYASGYYDWPRAITAEELADSMDVSSSTLHQHLRKGLWNLLSAFLEEQRE